MDRPYLFQQQEGGGGGGALRGGAQGGRDGVPGMLDYATTAGGGGGVSHPHGLFVGGGGTGLSSNHPLVAASDHLSFFAPASMSQQMRMQQHLQMTMVPIMLYHPAPLSLAPPPPLSQAAEDILRRLGNGTTGGGTETIHNDALLPSRAAARRYDGSNDPATATTATADKNIIGAAGDGLQLLFEATMLQEREQQQASAAADPQPTVSSSNGHGTTVLPPTVPPQPQPAIKRKSLPLSSSFSGRHPSRSNSHSHPSPGSSTSSSRLSSKKRRKLAKVVLGSNTSKSKTKANKVVAKYGIMDVLCGRGGLANRHDGNLVYRKVVESNKALYKTVTNKRHRQFLAESIVLAIQQAGGRFLEQMNPVSKRAMMLMAKANAPHNAFVGTSTFVSEEHEYKIPERDVVWKEVPFQKAVLKTSQALRETDKASGKGSGGASAASLGSESPDIQQHRRFPTTSLPLSTAMSSPAQPLSPPPRLAMNQPTASLSSAVAAPVVAASVVVRDATNNVGGNHSSSNGGASSSGSTTGSASSSLANYHDARQDAVAVHGGGDGDDDADMARGEHERPSSDHGRMSNGHGSHVEVDATFNDDDDNDGAVERVVEDDDDWSSSSSSSASSSPRYRGGAGVSFVPVASSHLALSHAFFQQQQPAAKAG